MIHSRAINNDHCSTDQPHSNGLTNSSKSIMNFLHGKPSKKKIRKLKFFSLSIPFIAFHSQFRAKLMDLKSSLASSSCSSIPDGEQFLTLCKKCDLLALKKLASKPVEWQVTNAKDENGLTGLTHLCMKGRNDCIKMLSEMDNVDPNVRDKEGNTPLILATQYGHSQVISCLVNNFRKKIDLDMRNDFGFTALMKAAILGRTRCVQVLLNAGATATLRDPSRGFTALQWAQYCGRSNCVDEMIKILDNTSIASCKSSTSDKKLPLTEAGLMAKVASSSTLCASSPLLPQLSSVISSVPESESPSDMKNLTISDRRKSLSVPQIIITTSSSTN